MKTKLLLLATTLLFLSLNSCTKEGVEVEYHYYGGEEYAMMSEILNIPPTPLAYTSEFPTYHPGRSTTLNKDEATLGRVLFYDTNLSSDRTISCASCHDQKAGFADNIAFSKGVNNRSTTRNSLALGSVFSFNEHYGDMSFGRVPFFWDNRASSVSEQATETFANDNEMDMDMHEVVSAVKQQPYYEPLFKAAYGTEVATEETILEAITIFINSISSVDSKYDDALSAFFDKNGSLDGIQTTDLEGLSEEENRGKSLYMNNCANCHGETNGVPGELFANNGLDVEYTDLGMGGISNRASEIGVFKVPTLRNISLTAPYMHDGRFETLDEVLDFYKDGIQDHQNLSQKLRSFDGTPVKFNFSEQDKADLIAFMGTFVDNVMANAEKYSDPFKY